MAQGLAAWVKFSEANLIIPFDLVKLDSDSWLMVLKWYLECQFRATS